MADKWIVEWIHSKCSLHLDHIENGILLILYNDSWMYTMMLLEQIPICLIGLMTWWCSLKLDNIYCSTMQFFVNQILYILYINDWCGDEKKRTKEKIRTTGGNFVHRLVVLFIIPFPAIHWLCLWQSNSLMTKLAIRIKFMRHWYGYSVWVPIHSIGVDQSEKYLKWK